MAKPLIALGLIATCLAPWGIARADFATPPYLDLPIHQTVNRSGALRYAVWVTIGERRIEALLDTGSTGLRVLAPVMPNPPASSTWTDQGFGGTLRMKGRVVPAPIEIGSMTGKALVQVVDEVACANGRRDCGIFPVDADSFRIGGDAFPHQGYSAILGIGLPFTRTDLANPLESVGVKRWIIDLPRPNDLAPGHLILDPGTTESEGFSILPRSGNADADGCLEGSFLTEKKCGTVLFDTGAPAISLTYDGLKAPLAFKHREEGTLTLSLGNEKAVRLAFQAGESGGLCELTLTPPLSSNHSDPFIVAGVSPFFTFDMLYDAAAHTVALRQRSPMRPPGEQHAEDAINSFKATKRSSHVRHSSL